MNVSWSCRDCPAHGDNLGWARAHREAERHTRETGHTTAVRTVGAQRERAGGRVVDRRPVSLGECIAELAATWPDRRDA